MLESLPGNSIDRIEVMTTPPPQYATETGGVINIVTKKGRVGYYQKLWLSAGTNGQRTGGTYLSYKSKKITLISIDEYIRRSKLTERKMESNFSQEQLNIYNFD